MESNEKIRLQLYMSRSGVASRRHCEEFITNGRVRVNGVLVKELGVCVTNKDTVELDGKRIRLIEEKKYILLHKPVGYVCSNYDPESRPLAISLIKSSFDKRLFSIGRLDTWSSGLIIFTNDGDFAMFVGHPSSEIEKEYFIELDKKASKDLILAFKEGISINGWNYKAIDVKTKENDKQLIVTLVEGKNREIRRVLDHFSYRALMLKRIRIGILNIDSLDEGNWREISKYEIDSLYKNYKA